MSKKILDDAIENFNLGVNTSNAIIDKENAKLKEELLELKNVLDELKNMTSKEILSELGFVLRRQEEDKLTNKKEDE